MGLEGDGEPIEHDRVIIDQEHPYASRRPPQAHGRPFAVAPIDPQVSVDGFRATPHRGESESAVAHRPVHLAASSPVPSSVIRRSIRLPRQTPR